MIELKAIWRSIRPGNLFIIGVTFIIMWALMKGAFQKPLLEFDKVNSLDSGFFLLVLSIIAIAAGGNLLNDYSDIEADKINRPFKNLTPFLGKFAIWIYGILTVLGIFGSIQASIKLGNPLFVIYPISVSALLFAYSRILQRIPLAGNLSIALLCGSIPLITYAWFLATFKAVHTFQPRHDYLFETGPIGYSVSLAFYISLFYAASAFVLTMSREIVKDIQDQEGDNSIGQLTILNFIGLKKVKVLLQILYCLYIIIVLFTILSVAGVFNWTFFSESSFTFALSIDSLFDLTPQKSTLYLASLVIFIAPAIVSMYMTKHLSETTAKRASAILKITMLLGLSSCLFFWFL